MFKFVGKGVKKSAGTVASWANVRGLKSDFGFFKRIFQFIFGKKELEPNETFEQAVKRLKLTPEKLEERKKAFTTQLAIFSLGALAVAIYTIYLMIHAYWISVVPTVLITVFLIVNALKSHFWLYQIKHKKLGCTWQEWFNASFKELK